MGLDVDTHFANNKESIVHSRYELENIINDILKNNGRMVNLLFGNGIAAKMRIAK